MKEIEMTDKEQKRKKLVRTLIYVFAATVVLLVVVTLVVGQLPAPVP
jgi:predicted nucleic acid-binding Zn ribbon protein